MNSIREKVTPNTSMYWICSVLQLTIENKEKEIDFLKGRLARYEPIDMVPTGSTRLPAC